MIGIPLFTKDNTSPLHQGIHCYNVFLLLYLGYNSYSILGITCVHEYDWYTIVQQG